MPPSTRSTKLSVTTFTDEDFHAWLSLRRKEWLSFTRDHYQIPFSDYLLALNVFMEDLKNGG